MIRKGWSVPQGDCQVPWPTRRGMLGWSLRESRATAARSLALRRPGERTPAYLPIVLGRRLDYRISSFLSRRMNVSRATGAELERAHVRSEPEGSQAGGPSSAAAPGDGGVCAAHRAGDRGASARRVSGRPLVQPRDMRPDDPAVLARQQPVLAEHGLQPEHVHPERLSEA